MSKKDLERAKSDHDKFLRRMGCLPSQIKERKKKPSKLTLNYTGTAESYFDKKTLSDVLQGDCDTATKRDIISNLYKLDSKDRRLVLQKSNQVAVLVNKSGYGVITPGMDPTTFGKK